MQSQFLTTILLALCVAHGVLSIPLDFSHAEASDDSERENLARLNAAKALANKNILKMEHVLNNPTQPGHQEMIDAAFGTDDSVKKNMKEVKKTVGRLKSGVALPVKLATDPDRSVVAYTQYEGDSPAMTPKYLTFGKKYHSSKTSDETRAATLIHEATHFQSNTGDRIYEGAIVPGNEWKKSSHDLYTSGKEPYKTAAELNRDKKWTGYRDASKDYFGNENKATKNLHNAAEPYAQFSSMCGAAVSDAAVGLRRRAMANRNWDEAATHLIRRQFCSLPRKSAKTSGAAAKTRLAPNAKSALTPKSKSTKPAASRVASAKSGKQMSALRKQRKAPVGKSPLSRSKKGAAASRKLGPKKAVTASKKSPLSRTRVSKSTPGTLSRGRAPKTGGSAANRVSKGRTAKGLAKARPAKKVPVSSKRPIPKIPVSKRPLVQKNSVTRKPQPPAKKSVPRTGAPVKSVARPVAKKSLVRRGSRSINLKQYLGPDLKKNVARPIVRKKKNDAPVIPVFKTVALPADRNAVNETSSL